MIHDIASSGDGDPGLPRRRPRVVVVGAGHGGLEVVRNLRREDLDIVVIDRHNYHTFQPLLYQVATAGLQPGDIAQPARHLFRGYGNVRFRLGDVVGANLTERTVAIDSGEPEPYDWLVLAAGASTTFFGVPGADRHAFPLKTLADAVAIRTHLLQRFEAADREPARVDEGALTVAVVGGGATGVEMAGALVELIDRVLAPDYPTLDVARARVVIVEAGDSVLDAYKPNVRDYAKRTLERRSVEFRFGAKVTRVDEAGVDLSTGERLAAGTVIWAAGVRAHPLADALGLPLAAGHRIVVDDTLSVPGHPEVIVVGDLAGAADPTGALYPQVAQVAIQQGRLAARQVKRALRDLEPLTFRYRDPGNMATIGRNAAVLQMPGGRTMTGFFAWIGWLIVHVLNLVGLRNRLQVLLSWLYNYLTYDRGPRLIFPPQQRPEPLRNVPSEPTGPLRG